MTDVDVVEQILYYKRYLEKYLEKRPDEAKILHVLKKLRKLPVELDHLQVTGIGKTVNSYRKHDGNIGPKAKELIGQWKSLVPTEGQETDQNDGQQRQQQTQDEPMETENGQAVMEMEDLPAVREEEVREPSPEHVNHDVDYQNKPDNSDSDSQSRDQEETQYTTCDRPTSSDKPSRSVEKHSSSDKLSSSKDRHLSSAEKHSSRDKSSSSKDKHSSSSKDRHSSSRDKSLSSKDKHRSSNDSLSSSKDKHRSSNDHHSSSKDKHRSSNDHHHSSKDKHRSSNDHHSSSKENHSSNDKHRDKHSLSKERSPSSKDRNSISKEKSKHKENGNNSIGHHRNHSDHHSDEKIKTLSGDQKAKSREHELSSHRVDRTLKSDKDKGPSHREKGHRGQTEQVKMKQFEVPSCDDASEVENFSKNELCSLNDKINSFRAQLSENFDIFEEDKDIKETIEEMAGGSEMEWETGDKKAGQSSKNREKKAKEREPKIEDARDITENKKQEGLHKEIEDREPVIKSKSVKFAEAEIEPQSGADSQDDNDGVSFADALLGFDPVGPITKKKKTPQKSKGSSSSDSSKEKAKTSKITPSSDSGKHSSGHSKSSKESSIHASGHSKESSKHSSGHSKDSSGHSKESSKHSHGHSKESSKYSSGHSKDSSRHSSGHSKDTSKHSSHRSHDSSDRHSKESSSSRHGSSSRKDKHGDSDKKHSKHTTGSEDSENRKRKSDTVIDIPRPSKKLMLSPSEIVGNLPSITPNYKPLPHLPLDYTSPHKKAAATELDETLISTKKQGRTMVYSGKKTTTLTAVPRLFDACMRILMDNIDAIDYVGSAPYMYDIMKPVLTRCTPAQLLNLEEANPMFVGQSDELWEKHCDKDFRSARRNEEDFETWRELYLRKSEERERKLKKLTSNISKSMQKALPEVKKTRLAYVDVPAKAPRDVRKRQLQHGTAGPSKVDHLAKLTSHKDTTTPKPPRISVPKPEPPPRRVKNVAPMMVKSLKLMKNLKGHKK